MRRLLFIVIAAMGMFKGQSQALVQTYTDRCTGEVKVFTVQTGGQTVVAYYNRSRTFTSAEFTNGTLRGWLEETYAWWQALSPCSTGNATSQTTQQTTSQATSNATNAANNAASGATQNTGTTNTGTNANTGSTGSTGSTGTGSTGSSNSSSGGTSGGSSNSNSSGGDSSGSSGGDSGSSAGGSDSGSNDNSSGSDNSSGDGTGSDDNSSGGSEGDSEGGTEEGSSGESTEETKKEEKKEEVKEEKKEESKEEEKKEEESKEEKEEEKEEETKEEAKEEEEEDEKEKKKNLAPPIVTANIVTMQMVDGVLTNAASFGYSQSSLTGEDTYSANAMIWSNLKQFSINLSTSHVYFNYDRDVPLMIKDPDTGKNFKFGSYKDRGTIMKVQSVSAGYMKMFSTHIVTAGISDVYMGQKDNFWKGFVGGYAITGMGVALEDGQVITTAALTAFGTKPFKVRDRFTVSPMLAYAMTPFSYNFGTNEETWSYDGTWIIGSNFDFNLTQRFKANLGGTLVGSTIPDIPLSFAITIGSRFQF